MCLGLTQLFKHGFVLSYVLLARFLQALRQRFEEYREVVEQHIYTGEIVGFFSLDQLKLLFSHVNTATIVSEGSRCAKNSQHTLGSISFKTNSICFQKIMFVYKIFPMLCHSYMYNRTYVTI